MKKKRISKVITSALVVAVVAVLLLSVVLAPQAEASSYSAAFISRNENLKLDYQDYLDKKVAYKLPDSVKEDDRISLVVMLEDVTNIYDAYQKTDKSQSFADFALFSKEAAEIEKKVAARKAEILGMLDEQNVDYTVTGIDYATLLAGFEIYITARDFETTCKALGDNTDVMVSEAYHVAESQVVENPLFVTGNTGITDTTGIKFDGSGMVVAVLDTGLDYAHSAFDPSRFTSNKLGLTYNQVAALLNQTMASEQYAGLSVDDVYISDKVPFGFDYADYDPDVYSTHNNHGTHVSGIIVGNDDTIKGVAPNAQLVSMKVFSDVYDTALASWILSALEDCVILGVDVINMSLGTACGFSREGDEEKLWGVYDKIRESGISLIVAASNSYSSAYGSDANGNLGLTTNPDTGTVGSPGTYDGAMSVASIDGTLTPYLLHGETIIYFTESNDNGGNPLDFCASILNGKESMELEFVVVPGVGRAADYTGLDVKGKIALVRRGSTTFEEKALLAQNNGAIGIIIYNNVAGDIKMNVGDATLASCSISQDAGEALAATGGGKLTISVNQAAGPFISDFSSWGPTPDLSIKPEITGYGGNILSSVTGGGYERLSGTSMATPNLAGISILLRQYVMETFPEIADNDVAINDMVYRLLMSTADITYNKNGLPYAVRKQGAGLANPQNAMATAAVLLTYDANGDAMDKVKLELGDDAGKTGVYTMTFTVQNFGSGSLSYDIGAYVMTEGVSETLTNAGLTTVTEQGYLLSGAKLTVDSVTGGTINGTNLTVAAGQDAKVTVTITLSDADKAYLDASFANGMYVEGFITLTATDGTEIDMSVPYLAFYGDWTKAPIFDKEYYETNADELNDAIDEEDKNKASAYPTTAIGGISDDYVSYLGSYYFEQDPSNTRVISANKDYIALSNQEGTIHSLRFVWAGLLRNCAKVEIAITDDTTGEVIYQAVDTDIRKSYGDGGSIYPANIEIEFDTMDYNMMNNTEYTVTLTGYVDYGNGGLETNERNVFSFPLVVDFEAPTVTDANFYYTYDKTLEKNRLYVDLAVYDNHYAMAMQVGYVGMTTNSEGAAELEIKTFSQYMTPIYSVKNGVTVVTYELTDYIYDIKANAYNGTEGRVTGDSFVVTCYDYALNYATFEIGLPNDYSDFYMDGLTDLTLSPNEVYSMEPLVYPNDQWAELLEYRTSNKKVVDVVNNKLVAVAPGSATIQVKDPSTNKTAKFKVTVLSEGDEGYIRYDKPVADVFRLDGFYVNNAFFQVNSATRDLGTTGDVRYFDGNYSLSMYPDEQVTVLYTLDAFFPEATSVVFSSSNDNVVTVSPNGTITAQAEGYASITVKIYLDDKATFYSESIIVIVKDPFVTSGASLSNYFGKGGVVTIPSDLKITAIGSFAFSNFDYVMKTEEEYARDDSSLSKQWFLGNDTITKVIIPEGVKVINSYAFASLTALEEVVLPSTLESIEYGAFYGCTSLKKISFSSENNLKIVNQSAFEKCDLQGTLDLPSAYVISNYAFAGNADLKGVNLPDTLQTIGAYAFAGCSSLKNVNIAADKVKFGEYAFTNCSSLESFDVNSSVISAGLFYNCENLKEVNIGKDVKAIYEYAFRDTAVTVFNVESGNAAFKVQSADYVISADGKTLLAVSPVTAGEFTSSNMDGHEVVAIGRGAFSHNTRITAVTLPNVTTVDAYGFAVESVSYSGKVSAGRLQTLNLGQLTYIGDYGFCGIGVETLPAMASDAKIGKYAFAYSALKSVHIPDGMTIPTAMFYECSFLSQVTIGDNVTIGDRAFYVDRDNHFTIKRYKDAQGNNRYYYVFESPLTSLVIGDNVTIGDNAFANAASLETVTLGDNAVIGKMAFYNCSSLKSIDLSKVLSVGEYAFSGDVFNVCMDTNMTAAAVSSEGTYIYSYHGPVLETVDLSMATEIGAYAFAYCRQLTGVVLNSGITEIPEYAFAGCIALTQIDLSNVATVGDYAFMETAVAEVNLVNATNVGKYAFVICPNLSSVTLNPAGTVIAEGAFAQNEKLNAVANLEMATEIGAYAFAYTGIVNADLSGAVSIGDFAFMKTEPTAFTVVLGDQLVTLGDNPFAMCMLAPFYTEEIVNFNGVEYKAPVYTYNISESVLVIDGSLYYVVPNGLELITYTGMYAENVLIAEGTVRISGQALAGSDVRMVTLPESLKAVGHKAFYRCENLKVVVFTSFDAPILEEEFDSSYYESLEHIPGTGNHGEYDDYDGNKVQIEGNGQIPYFMWNATGGLYHNVFYGANFVDYVGYVENKLIMVRPSNGQKYDTYILGQYFDLGMMVDGTAAADANTKAFIDAINRLPNPVRLSDEEAVVAARALYSKLSNLEQQALASEAYGKLLTAEQRIAKLKENSAVKPDCDHSDVGEWEGDETNHWKSCVCGEKVEQGAHAYENGKCVCGKEDPNYQPEQPENPAVEKKQVSNTTIVIVLVALIAVGVVAVILLNLRAKKKEKAAETAEEQ